MKNLINYLSKKSLSLENGSRMVRDRFEIGSAKSRKSIGSNLSRLCLASLICLSMQTVGVGNVWGAEGDVIKEFNCDVSTKNTYARQTPTCDDITWNVSWGQTSYIGTNKAANYGNLKITNSTDLNAGKAVNASITTTTQGYCAIIPQSTMANVGKITISCSALNGSPAVYVVSSTSLSTAYTQITLKTGSGLAAQGATLTTSGLTFEFDKKATATYYAIVFYSANWYRLTSTDLQFIEGATAGCSNAVALSKGTATNGTVNTISSASVATCSATASDRRVTVTITPAACYDAPTNLSWTKSSGTVSASKQSGPTDNGDGTYSYVYQFAQNDNGAGTFGVTCTAKAAGKTVNFNAGPGSCGTSSLTEDCDGSGVTLPAVTASGICKGWTTFAGWATAAVNDSSTTSVTVYAAYSKFVPASNGQTLYAVYSKNKSGGSSSVTIAPEDLNVKSGNAINGATVGTITFGGAQGNNGSASNVPKYYSGTPNTIRCYASNDFTISSTNTISQIDFTYNGSYTGGTITLSTGSWAATPTTGWQQTWTGSATSIKFRIGSTAWRITSIKVTTGGGSTTYYCSDPNCCTPLGSVNGSFNFTTPTTAVLTWDNVANVSSWAVSCILHGGSNAGSVGSITTNGSGKKTCTITGLSCNTNYDFTITATPNSGYCEKSETLENKNSGQYTVTSTLTGITPSSALPTTTCDGFTITSMSATSSTHHLPNDITVLGASYTWNSSTGNLVISSVTGNVTITIAAVENSCTHYSFHWGTTKGSEDQVTCLNFVTGTTDTYRSALWTVPTTGGWTYVGWQGGWHNDNAKSANLGMTSIPYDKDHSKTLQRAEAGNVGGAQGYIQVYGNSSDANKYVGFLPAGYVMRILNASSELQSTKTLVSADGTIDGNLWHTNDVFELTAAMISGKYDVDLKTSDGYVWAEGRSNTDNVAGMKVKNGNGTYRATDLAAGDAGMRGRFGIYANSGDNNWYCHFVPYYRVTYNGSGASGSTAASADVCCEGNAAARTVVAAANGFTVPTGKTFGGWASSPENAAAGVVAYAAGANVVLTSSITLYAIWTDINYTVTVNQNPNVSATTTGQTSSAHYNGTINLTTTVPSGYRFVNWTTSDGFSITNSTSATTASFTMPNKNVTITANFQQTHKVDWYVGGSAPANKIGDDGQTTMVDHGGKISDFPATTPDGSACDKTFVGWTNTSSYVHGTSPLFNDVAGSPTINADASFYAVFAEGGSTEYVLTPAASLTAGEYVIAAYDDTNSKYLALTGAVSAASLGSNSDMVNETTGFTISEGKFTTLPTGACEFVLTAYTGETDNGFYIQNPADDKYLDYQTNTNRRLWFYAATDYEDGGVPTTPWAAWYGVALSKDGFPDNGMYLKYVDETYSLMSNGSGTTFIRGYANDNTKYKPIYLFKKTGGATGHTINCTSCANSVTVSYSDPGSGNTMAVTKGSTPIASGTSIKTCLAVNLTVTLTPAAHYTVTNFEATGVTGVTTTNVGNVYTVSIPADKTGTLTLTPTFTEDARVNITWNVNGAALTPEAAEGLTFVYSGGDITALPSTPSVPAGCSGTKEFVGWSKENSGATEEDAAYYDDLFTTAAGAPTGIASAKTFYAVFATSAGDLLAGQTMWAEDYSGYSHSDVPGGSTANSHTGTTVYDNGSVTYACTDGGSATKVYGGNETMYAGGTVPEILVGKNTGVFAVTGIPTGGKTTLTLTYKSNRDLTITSGTSGVTIGDADVSGTTYTRTITISQSPAVNTFALSFSNTTTNNSRLDDISVIVPGSASLTDYVTTCAASYTITYNKNTTDAVTNLPSPTSVLQSTGSGTLSDKVPTRATYTFMGWAETTNGAVAYAAGASITGVSADKTLYAVWQKTAVEELHLSQTSLDKYVGDPAVTLTVTSVLPAGADASVTWSSSNTTVAPVVAATGEVSFSAVGTATITATSTVTGTTTAYCYVTVREKPTATFVDLVHGLTEDKDGNALNIYDVQDVAGTAVTFPQLANQAAGDDCEGQHYIFVGWTDSDNNTDPEDNLFTSYDLENDVDKTFYAVWADGVEGAGYTKLTSSSFKTGTDYVLASEQSGGAVTYFYSCTNTDSNNSWGYCTTDPSTNAPMRFRLSGTASALVAQTKEATPRYLTPLTAKNFQLSASSKTVKLTATGEIKYSDDTDWYLRANTDNLRWYNNQSTGTAAYFYEVSAGAAVSYRTSCCSNNVAAPTVTATSTAYTVNLTWPAVANATGYEISWNGGAWTAATSPVNKTSLTPGTTYTYKVRATYTLPQCGALTASGSVTTNEVYTVTYAKGTGTGSCTATGTMTDSNSPYEAGVEVTLLANTYVLTGNVFAAWVVTDADDNELTVTNGKFTMPESNVTVTATWTAKQDKYFDRMHDGTSEAKGGVLYDGDKPAFVGKYHLVREGCQYTVPTLTDDTDGETACHTSHYKLLGWIAESYLSADGTVSEANKAHIFTGGGVKTADGNIYVAVWAEVVE